MIARRRIGEAVRLSLWMTALCMTGCAGGLPKLFEDHMANDRKARAKQQWEAMRANVKIQVAENHLHAGRLDEASKAIDEAVTLDRQNVKAYMLATQIEIERGELSKAKECIHAAMSYAHANPQVRYLAGVVAERYDDIPGALEHYTAASEGAPLVAEYLLARVEMLAAQTRDIEAIELLEARMSDFDANAEMRALAAYECRRLGLRGPAIEYGREALRLCPKDRAMKAELADTLAWAEVYGEAIKLYTSLLNDAPESGESVNVSEASLRIRLAAAQLAKGEARQALITLRPLVAVDAVADTTALSLYARAAVASGDYATAKRTINALHTQCRVTPESLMLLVLVYQYENDNVAALKAARQLIKIEGETTGGYCVLGRALERVGEVAEARDAYQAALRIDPAFAPARVLRDRLEPPLAAVTAEPVEQTYAEPASPAGQEQDTAAKEQTDQTVSVDVVESYLLSGDAISSWMSALSERVAAGAGEEGP